MTLQDLLTAERIRHHQTTNDEVGELLAVADRGLADARVAGISTDLRFSTAYDAALALATIVLAAAGYRTRGLGHHATTFEALPLILGEDGLAWADLFEACRSKRNTAHYRRAGQTTLAEAQELTAAVAEFRGLVGGWLAEVHPRLAVDE